MRTGIGAPAPVPVLAVFLDDGGGWQETADEPHVHINTLRHRLERVDELTGRSLADESR